MRRLRLALSGMVVAGAAGFAFWPVRPEVFTAPVIEREAPMKREATPLNLAAFRAPIWVAEAPPPAPVAAAAPAPPPPPLKIQLLAIVKEGAVYKAAVYDPDTDRIVVVAEGEKVGARLVERVEESRLTLRDQVGARVLALREGGRDEGR